MATRTKPRKPPVHRTAIRRVSARRDLLEFVAPSGSPLKVDREKCVIYGVKVLGRYSRNSHGKAEASAGTEYSPACMDDAIRRQLYEGVKVRANHPPKVNGRRDAKAERDVHDSLGVLRDVRKEVGSDGQPGLYADLHYLKTHPLAESVCEDVERGLGVYGLSHNADTEIAAERFDPAARRLVIESIHEVRSVDLVDKPATNRNLWESEQPPMATTIRELISASLPDVSEGRKPWLTWLLEDDITGTPMDAPPAEDAEPEDKLWAGFQDAILTILAAYKEDGDAAAAAKKIAKWLKAHSKLTGASEPEDVPEEEEEEDDKGKKGKAESVNESEELVQLRTEKKVRQLCETLDFTPTELQVDALAGLPDEKKRKALIESFKQTPAATGGGKAKPRSGYAPKPAEKKPAGTEPPKADPAADLAALRR